MMNFKNIVATDYCNKVADGTHDSPKRQDKGKFLITSRHIKGRSIDFENAYLISEEDFNQINQRSKVDQWDILISMIGEYCGFSYVERNEIVDYAVKNVGIFKTGDKIKAQWLYYYLISPDGKNTLLTLRSGTSQPYIPLGALRALEIPVPEDETKMEQIVNTLSSLDDKIELNQQMNQTLEAMAQAIFKEWFVNFNFQGFDGELVDGLPKGWKIGKLKDVCEIKYGKDHKHLGDGGIPVYGSGGIMRFADQPLYSKHSILIPRKGTLSNLFYVSRPFWSVDTMFYTIIKSEYLQKYLFYLLKTLNLASRNVGSAVPSLTTDVLNKIEIRIPDEKTLEDFEALISSFYSKMEENEFQIHSLTQIRDSLLPKLMTGKIEIQA